MAEFLKNIDTNIFLFINNHHCFFFDFIFYWASSRWTWIPFYVLLAFTVYKNSGTNCWKILIAILVLIILTDQVSVFIKDHAMRYRPCHNLIFQLQVHLINGECGGQFGFVSSHAANSAGLAVFLILLFRKKIRWIAPAMLTWCCIVSYSRIYLGTHYPLDVVGGWITGLFIAIIIFYFYKNFLVQKIKT